MGKVLAVVSSGYVDDSNDYMTGWWAEELFEPILELEKEGHVVGIASPDGGKPVVDPKSLEKENDPEGTYKTLYESGIVDKTLPIVDVKASEFDAVYIVGGHGPMFDLAHHHDLHAVLNIIHLHGGIIAAISHGVAPLLFTKMTDGSGLLDGLKVTGYPTSKEPEEVKQLLPFDLEQELSRIADYSAEEDAETHVVWGSPQILTARSPNSSKRFGEELAQALNRKEEKEEAKFFD